MSPNVEYSTYDSQLKNMEPLLLLFYIFSGLQLCQTRRAAHAELFIVPILWHGPNNQLTEIKEAISFSQLITRTVTVIPDLLEHKFSDGGVNWMRSNELFDLPSLEKSKIKYILLDNLLKDWDGALDAVLFFRNEEFPQASGADTGSCVLSS